jgi:hypothetical protein
MGMFEAETIGIRNSVKVANGKWSHKLLLIVFGCSHLQTHHGVTASCSFVDFWQTTKRIKFTPKPVSRSD